MNPRCTLAAAIGVWRLYRLSTVNGSNLSPPEPSGGPPPFWEDLVEDLKDLDFLRQYVVESARIATIDRVVNALDEARAAAGLSKGELARAMRQEPAAVRRLFSAGQVNPTLGTLAEVAGALGLRITVEPLPEEERDQITGSLLAGYAADVEALADFLSRSPRPIVDPAIPVWGMPTGRFRRATRTSPRRCADASWTASRSPG